MDRQGVARTGAARKGKARQGKAILGSERNAEKILFYASMLAGIDPRRNHDCTDAVPKGR